MKITAFNPLIMSPNAAQAIALFKELGFETRHLKEGIEGNVSTTDMKNPDGFRIDVAQVDVMPQDMTVIRLSVRDFDEAYELLTAHGFKLFPGSSEPTDTGTSKAALLMSPSGFGISLAQHYRKDE